MSDTLSSNEQVTPVDGLIAESRAVLATHLNGTWKDDYAALRLAQMVRALLARIEETTALQRELQRARDTIDTFEMEANPRPAHEPEVESPPVEVWNGDRKVTIYEDVVIRVWGPHIENEMSDEPRSHGSVNAAIKWLYSSEPPLRVRDYEEDGETLTECLTCGCLFSELAAEDLKARLGLTKGGEL